MTGDKPVWSIDPVTFALHPDRATGEFTYREFMDQDWPACPVCGRIVRVDACDVQDFGQKFPSYLPGRWRCPIGCVPGRDLPPPALTPAEYAENLQEIADARWPDAGVEVQVKVWRRLDPCPHCGAAIEAEVFTNGGNGAWFHRDSTGKRVPHWLAGCCRCSGGPANNHPQG